MVGEAAGRVSTRPSRAPSRHAPVAGWLHRGNAPGERQSAHRRLSCCVSSAASRSCSGERPIYLPAGVADTPRAESGVGGRWGGCAARPAKEEAVEWEPGRGDTRRAMHCKAAAVCGAARRLVAGVA